MKRFIEVWHSDNNREERHYFLKNEGAGYQQHAYLFGYNPQIISEAQVEQILEIIDQSPVYQKLNFGDLA